MPIYPLQRVFYPQNRPCIPKIVGTFYMQGYKVKEKTAIVPHCTPSFKTQWAPWFKSTWDNSFNIIEHLYLFSVYKVIFGFCSIWQWFVKLLCHFLFVFVWHHCNGCRLAGKFWNLARISPTAKIDQIPLNMKTFRAICWLIRKNELYGFIILYKTINVINKLSLFKPLCNYCCFSFFRYLNYVEPRDSATLEGVSFILHWNWLLLHNLDFL
jgi:hypothetical protein